MRSFAFPGLLRVLSVGLVLAAGLVAGDASADDGKGGAPKAGDPTGDIVVGPPVPVAAAAPVAPAAASKRVEWNESWSRFSFAELALSAAITLRNGDFGEALDGPRSATIRFEVPVLDHGARDLLRLESPGRRKGAGRLSDIGFRSMVLAPYLVDVGLGALVLNKNPDVALQLALIDFEVLTLAGMTQLLGSRLLGRARPYVTGCAEGSTDPACGGGPYRSFLSGHTMATFAAAGLVCVHHEYLPLFGGGIPDSTACGFGVTVGAMVGVLRIMADEHWASDVLIGAGMGWLYGYYLPKLLHFHTKKLAKRDGGKPSTFTWLPTFAGSGDRMEAGITGAF